MATATSGRSPRTTPSGWADVAMVLRELMGTDSASVAKAIRSVRPVLLLEPQFKEALLVANSMGCIA